MNEEVLQTILRQALTLFSQYGLRNVSMDDIAKQLGMSKKTIYQYVEDKDDLVQKSFSLELSTAREKVENIIENHDNALEAVIQITMMSIKKFKEINPVAIFELQKYFPQVWVLMAKHKEECTFPNVEKVLQKGIEQGYFRKEMNASIVSRLHSETIRIILDPNNFPPEHYNLSETHLEAQDLFIRSIVTQQGLEIGRAHV